MSILEWLGLSEARGGSQADGLAAIADALEGMDPSRARFLACFAYALTRAARADGRVTEDEAATMERVVVEYGRLPPEQAARVVRIARAEATRSGGTDDFLVTRELNTIASREEKLALVECLFAIAAADETILTVEDNEVRRIANELKLEHHDYIAARTRYLQHLQVLRDTRSG